MAAIDVQSQEGPSARTVSAVLDAAAERLAAAGVENARADAEVLVADAMGVKPEELSVESAGEIPAEVAAAIEERVARRVDREPMAYILGRAPFRSLEVAVDERVLWPRRETELLVEVGAWSCPRAPASTRSAPAPGRSRWRCWPSVPTSRSPPRTSRRRRSKPRARTPSGSASSSTSASPPASPTGSRASTW